MEKVFHYRYSNFESDEAFLDFIKSLKERSIIDSGVDVYADDEMSLLKLAYSLEIKSEHPLAKAIIKYAEEKNISSEETEDFQTRSHSG